MREPLRDLTEGSIVQSIVRLALPTMVTNVLQNAFSIVDMIFVGRLGPSAIAAVGMSGVILGVLASLIMGISAGTIAMVARFIGAKRSQEAENVAMQSFFLGVFSYVIIAIIGCLLSSPILKILGASGDVVLLGVKYLRVMFLGSLTMIFLINMGSALRAAGDVITPLKIMIMCTVLNIALDPLLIYGWWKLPGLGVTGSALATVIARGAGTVFLLQVMLRGRAAINLRKTNAKIDFPIIRRVVRIGVFSSMQVILRNIEMVTMMRLIAIYGTFAVAAGTIGSRLRMIVIVPAYGLGAAASTLVGQNLGANEPGRAAKTAWITAGSGAAIMTLFGLMYIAFSRNLVSIFNTHPEVIKAGASYLTIIAGTFGFVALSIILGQAFVGAGDTLSPMVIAAMGLIVFRIGLSLLFSWKLGLIGLWFGIASANIIQALISCLWFGTGRWKSKRV